MAEPNTPKAATYFHRALITLIPAFGCLWGAYLADFAWYLLLPGIALVIVGINLLRLGARTLNRESRS